MSTRTRGEGLGNIDRDRLAAFCERTQRPGHDLLEPDVAEHELQRAGLQAAHVEQVADEVVEPVGLLVDRLEKLVYRVSGPDDVTLQQARDRGLDR